jgi:transposase-like protein
MTRQSPYVFELSAVDRAVLEERSRDYTARYADVVRAKIVLLSADGLAGTEIAERLDVPVGLVRTWRKRFAEAGLDGLADRPRRRAGPVDGVWTADGRPVGTAPPAPSGAGAQVIPFPARHDPSAALDALRQLASSIDRYLAEVDGEPSRRAGGPTPRRR